MGTTTSSSWQNSIWSQRYRLLWIAAEAELSKEEEELGGNG